MVVYILGNVIYILLNYMFADKMQRARMISTPLPRDATEVRLTQKEWGIERSYKTPNGNEISTATVFFYSNITL